MSTSIFVALSTFAQEAREPLALLEQGGVTFSVNKTGKRLSAGELIAGAQDADGVVAGLEPYDAAVLGQLPRLKCISRCGVGLDNIDLAVAKQRGIEVLNTPQAVIQPVAELTLAMIFDLFRQVSVHTHLMRQHRWEKHTGLQLAGKRIGIIGLGRIGRRVAELLRAVGCDVIGCDINPDRPWAHANQVVIGTLDEVLSSSDAVSIHVTSMNQHPLMIGSAQLTQMKKGAFLINTSRGAMVDESALVALLRSGHLAGAGLDVFVQEPYAGPLCDLPNVILTPHVATLTKESRSLMEIEAVRNVLGALKK